MREFKKTVTNKIEFNTPKSKERFEKALILGKSLTCLIDGEILMEFYHSDEKESFILEIDNKEVLKSHNINVIISRWNNRLK